jgi:hypothetical protein
MLNNRNTRKNLGQSLNIYDLKNNKKNDRSESERIKNENYRLYQRI